MNAAAQLVLVGGRCEPTGTTRIPSILVAIRDDGKAPGPSERRAADSASAASTERASFNRRFGALLIDWLLCLMATGLIADPQLAPWLPVLLLIFVYGFFVGLFAQTPGMFLTRIRCVSYADGGSVGVLRAALRGVLLCLAIPPLIMDAEGRGLHDRAVGSIVVPAPGRPSAP